MGEKSWRIKDEQEFLRQANHYLEQHLENFMDNVDTQIVDRKKRKEVWRKFNIYRRNSINSVYVNNIRLKISDMLRIVLEDVKNWIEFSLNKESPLDEIMLRLIINSQFNCSYVSHLFISVNPNLTEEFVEDAIYVSSNLFEFDEWDDKHVNAVVDAASHYIPENVCVSLLELYDKKRLTDKVIPIRINLKEFCCINKNPVFTLKYCDYFNQTDAEIQFGKGKRYKR